MDPIEIRFRVALVTLISVIAGATLGFMYIERLSLLDSFYFSIVTVTTVGFGDIYPLSEYGKLFSIVIIILGVAGFLGIVTNGSELIVQSREKRAKKEKNDMIIGTFFSELGLQLLTHFSSADPEIDEVRTTFLINEDFSENRFLEAKNQLRSKIYSVDINKVSLSDLKSILIQKREFCVNLLDLPTLSEHEDFTETLRAVFHLLEELSYRNHTDNLPERDLEHLKKDIERAYKPLIYQWIHHMEYLKSSYPYLFALAIRMNPFDPDRSPIIK